MANLFDSLFNVDRPALNAYITQGQAQAGLRTAQTQEALQNAQAMQEKQQAYGNLSNSLTSMGFQPSESQAMTDYVRASGRDPNELYESLQNRQAETLTGIIADPNAPSAARIAAMQAAKKNMNVGQTQNVGDQLVDATNPNAPPTVTQTPQSQADIALKEAQAKAASANANLHDTQAAAGGFNPHAGSGMYTQPSPEQSRALLQFISENPSTAGNLRSLSTPAGLAFVQQWYSDKYGQPGAAAGSTPQPGAPAAASGAAPQPASGLQPPANGVSPAPGVSFHEQAAIRNDFASGVGARQTTSLNTMINHAALFDQVADQLQNGNFTPTNAIQQAWQRLFGSPAPTDLRTVSSFLGREAVRATVNSGAGTGEERELQIGDNASPAQLHGVAQELRMLGAGQLQSLELRARRGGVDISQLLSPEARAAFGMTSGAAPAASPAPAGNTAAPVSLDQYLKSKGF